MEHDLSGGQKSLVVCATAGRARQAIPAFAGTGFAQIYILA
jgi:hypothetical protein